MVIPNRYNTEFARVNVPATADVQDVLDATILAITTLAEPWTLVSGTEYESPKPDPLVSADQRSMRIEFSKESATRFGFHVKNALGVTVYDGSCNNTTNGPAVILVGSKHCAVDFPNATNESAWAAIVDTSPFSINSISEYVVAADVSPIGGGTGADQSEEAVMIDPIGPNIRRRLSMYACEAPFGAADRTSGGSIVPAPVEAHIEISSNNWRQVGKCFQMIIVPADLAPGTVLQDVSLGTSDVGGFYILKRPPVDTAHNGLIAIRAE